MERLASSLKLASRILIHRLEPEMRMQYSARDRSGRNSLVYAPMAMKRCC